MNKDYCNICGSNSGKKELVKFNSELITICSNCKSTDIQTYLKKNKSI